MAKNVAPALTASKIVAEIPAGHIPVVLSKPTFKLKRYQSAVLSAERCLSDWEKNLLLPQSDKVISFPKLNSHEGKNASAETLVLKLPLKQI